MAASGALGLPAVGQEALFNSLRNDSLAAQTRSSLEGVAYTARMGDLRLLVTPTLTVQGTDNVELQEHGAKSDVFFSPRLDLHAFHPIGQANILNLDLGIGYTKYLRTEQLDQLLVVPASSISFNMSVGEIRFNVHDWFSYQLNPALSGAVANTAKFGGINNSSGVTASWETEKIQTSLGYDYLRFISDAPGFDYLTRSTHEMVGRAGLKVHSSATVGLEGSTAFTAYDESVLNDNNSYSAGLYADWQVTEQLHVTPRGGYSLTTFSPNAFLGQPGDYTGYYFGLVAQHKPNDWLAYTLSANRHIDPGVEANLSDIFNVTLAGNWSVIRSFPINTTAFFEHGKQTAGGTPELWDRYGGSVGVSWEATQRITLGLNYSLTFRDSGTAGRDYLLNTLALTLSYRL